MALGDGLDFDFGDVTFPSASSGFDWSAVSSPTQGLDWGSGGGFDWGALNPLPSFDWNSIGTSNSTFPVTSPAPAVTGWSISKALQTGADLGSNFFKAQEQIFGAQASANLVKAQGQNAVAKAKTGNPSTYFLLIGGVAVVALLVTKK